MAKTEVVWKTFPPNHTVLEDFNLEIQEGETLVILGKSGSGKTTALRLINRLIDPTKGEVFVGEKNILFLILRCSSYCHHRSSWSSTSLWETTQTLFWAAFGLIDLDNFELAGIKEFTR